MTDIDYSLVLETVKADEQPASALEAFVAQEREVAKAELLEELAESVERQWPPNSGWSGPKWVAARMRVWLRNYGSEFVPFTH